MQLPAALKAALDVRLGLSDMADLRQAGERLTRRYRAETRDGRAHLASEAAVDAYLAARLPATFAAASASLLAAAEQMPDFSPKTLLDVGAGPGTIAWAASAVFPSLEQATLLEASRPAAAAGAELAKEGLAGEGRTLSLDWRIGMAVAELGNCPRAELVTLSYVLDELSAAEGEALVDTLWAKTDGMLVLVEPGTPAGWRRLMAARKQLLEAGAQLVAPCPHALACPLVEPDWCHFSQRVERSRVHRLAKNGTVPYEDEKFAYLAVSRAPVASLAATSARVLAPVKAGSGKVRLKLCTGDGTAEDRLVTKREGEPFRIARRLAWGDAWN